METLLRPTISACDLERACPQCKGDGEIPNTAWRGFDFKLGDPAVFARRHGPEVLRCPQCNGLGAVPTPAGRAVVAFIERHMPGLVG